MCPYPDILSIEVGAPIVLQKSALKYFQNSQEKSYELRPGNLRKMDSGADVFLSWLQNFSENFLH